jgi:polyhydroxybutyrate depolymerase
MAETTTAGSAAAGAGGAASAAASAGASSSAEMLPTCPMQKPLSAGESTHQVHSGDYDRKYLLHIPPGYDGKAPVALVFDFHGYNSSPDQQMGWSGFRELGDEEGFVVVYPEGIGASWHVDGCCGRAFEELLDEIAFVRTVMADVTSIVCIDPKRVYASGISQGGGMAHHVGCLAADIFSGVAPVSSDLRTDPCMPVRPVTEISFRGLADTLDAYEGGHVGPPGMEGYTAIGAKPTLERWKTINMCTGTAEMMGDVCETYTKCSGGAAVSLCSIPGGDHLLYQNPQDANLAKIAWDLFQKHPFQ